MLTWVGAVGRSKLTIHAYSQSHLVIWLKGPVCLRARSMMLAFEFDVAFRKIKSDFKKIKINFIFNYFFIEILINKINLPYSKF